MNRSIVFVGDILMIAFLWIFPHIGILPIYAYPVLLVLLLWVWLRFQKKDLNSIGLQWNRISAKSLIVGTAIAFVYFVLYYFLIGPFLADLLSIPKSDVSDFYFVRSSFSKYIIILAIAWLMAVPFEEIVFRGFVFCKLQEWTNKKFWLAGVVCSLLFGLYHIQQGLGGIIHSFVFGIFTILLYKYFKGNLWYLIFFHSAYDTIAITTIRMGFL